MIEEFARQQQYLERLKQLRPIDDDFMRCLFRDNTPLVEFVLRIILSKPDLTIISSKTQADLKRLAGARSVCLDVYGTDSANVKYNIEIERSADRADAHRARYHSGAIDVENLNASQSFELLPETYVIFITENDVFGDSRAVHKFERIDAATGVCLNDGSHIIYVNGQYRGLDNIGWLMHDFCSNNANSMHFELMAEKTRYLKETQKGAAEMCKIMEEIREEGREEGRIENLCELVYKGLLSFAFGVQESKLPQETFLGKMKQLYPDFSN